MFIIEKLENIVALLLPTKGIILILVSQIFTVITIQNFSMYVYTFKNGIVLYLLLCNNFFFFFYLACWEHPAIVLKCIYLYIFLRVVCFSQNWFKFCPIVAYLNYVHFSAVVNKALLKWMTILVLKSFHMSL